MQSIRLTVALILIFSTAHAQQPDQWQGEWGAFSSAKPAEGRRLSIHDCSATACTFSIDAEAGIDHAGIFSQPTLTLQSSSAAKAILPGTTGASPCTLHLQRNDGENPGIRVQADGETCTSYYATSSKVSMSGFYPLHATTNYGGVHVTECFIGGSAAKLATCTHPELAKLEETWSDLAVEYPLQPPEGGAYQAAQRADQTILHACDLASDPAQCLSQHYTADITAMQAKRTAYLAGTVTRGNPAVGGRLARQIAGRYRHSFQNGDVQGNIFISTDTLTITAVGAASIRFEIGLNFYNGHQCSLSGDALFRQDGSFVFDEAPDDAVPDAPLCRLAIIPAATGVRFKDITGGCKEYCGTRGGWNAASFNFNERAAPSMSAGPSQ